MKKKDRDVLFSSKSDEWSTPQYIFDKLHATYNFTLDPATDGINSKCVNSYDIIQDGLKQDWAGEVVFVNPPYSGTFDWVEKAYLEAQKSGVTTVLLVPARMDTKWVHQFCMDGTYCERIIFIKGRLKFGSSVSSAPFPSMVVVFTPNGSGSKFPYIDTMSNKP